MQEDTEAITGGRGIHWRHAAAICAGQAPTSRRIASCIGALQVPCFTQSRHSVTLILYVGPSPQFFFLNS